MEHLDVKLSLRILRSGTLSRKYFVERIVFSTLRSKDFAEKKEEEEEEKEEEEEEEKKDGRERGQENCAFTGRFLYRIQRSKQEIRNPYDRFIPSVSSCVGPDHVELLLRSQFSRFY